MPEPIDCTIAVYHRVVRHFVGLSWWWSHPAERGNRSRFGCASCFVVEVRGIWFLVTAAHVIRDLILLRTQGAEITQWRLEDQATGKFSQGVPFDFDPDRWIVIDDDELGSDYAAFPLSDLYQRQLVAAEIHPLDESAWLLEGSEKFDVLFMLGIPKESVREGSPPVIKLVIIPMDPCDSPAGHPRKPDRQYAKLRAPGPAEPPGVQDIDGMSGGPIFGLFVRQGAVSYRLLGIQSAWFAASRIVSFCPIDALTLGIAAAIDSLSGNIDSRG